MPTNAAQPLSPDEAARLTAYVMDACNLSGLAYDFPRAMEAAWDDVRAQGGGTDQVNSHPLAVLWIVKMAELAGLVVSDTDDRIHRSFDWLRKHARAA